MSFELIACSRYRQTIYLSGEIYGAEQSVGILGMQPDQDA
jgi:hypothetical protein